MVQIRGCSMSLALSLLLSVAPAVLAGDSIMDGGGLLDGDASKAPVVAAKPDTGPVSAAPANDAYNAELAASVKKLEKEVAVLKKDVARLKKARENRDNQVVVVVVNNDGLAGRMGQVGGEVAGQPRDPRFDPYGRPLPTDQYGRPLPTDAYGRPVDPFGRPVPTDQYGRPLPTDQYGRPVDQYGRPLPTDPYGRPVDNQGRPLPNYPTNYPNPNFPNPNYPNPNGPNTNGMNWWQKLVTAVVEGVFRGVERRVSASSNNVNSTYANETNRLNTAYPDYRTNTTDAFGRVMTDAYGRPLPTSSNGRPVLTDPYGRPVPTDQFGRPIPTDQFGRPITTDPYGRPIPTDQFGRPIPTPTDQFGRPIPTDQFGRPLPTDRFGRPISQPQPMPQPGRPTFEASIRISSGGYMPSQPLLPRDMAGRPILNERLGPIDW